MSEVPGEFHGKKTKLVAKTGGPKASVYNILKKMNIPDEEIPKFQACASAPCHS